MSAAGRAIKQASEDSRATLQQMRLNAIRQAWGHGCKEDDAERDAKRLANLKARCALQGVELHAIEADDGKPLFIGTRWALCRQMHSLDEVAEWVALIDGKTE